MPSIIGVHQSHKVLCNKCFGEKAESQRGATRLLGVMARISDHVGRDGALRRPRRVQRRNELIVGFYPPYPAPERRGGSASRCLPRVNGLLDKA
jgi:hypothetical protein